MSIRLLIVDDSPFVREVLREVLRGFEDILVVGEARDGQDALTKIEELHPDVITMDLLMPMVGGLETVENIMRRRPTPIVIVADASSTAELKASATAVGAVSAFAKPRGGFDAKACQGLVETLREAAATSLHHLGSQAAKKPTGMPSLPLARLEILAVVASTGGPKALGRFFELLPAKLPFPICVVQHTTLGFTETLVQWLGGSTRLGVHLGEEGQLMEPGAIYIAPDDHHMEIRRRNRVHLHKGPPLGRLRPAGDVLLRSVASTYGSAAAALICTGMGRDGSAGLEAISEAGGVCLVQAPATAVLDSMPRSALKRVPKSRELELETLARLLNGGPQS